ncbi:hypothetical protein [Nocardia caishijiensis]|uniref:Uncharacterized protein n=1 Tax=Nocardia caishijiensis TaxID=184756 RepID=A0ABQ6YKM7_9NOCA|nr:hypothetical protein [Nocardia caishijiensis]KAF0846001.1 hypothetical protein FNL39_106396 [Nocardia caishijiensis]
MNTTITLTDQDKATLRTAAYGAVSLIAAAGAPHKAVSHGSVALTSATGLVGHVLSTKSRDIRLPGKTVAELADTVLPSLTAAMAVLAAYPGEAANFRDTVLVAIDAATRPAKGAARPAVTAMAAKITGALDA